MYIYIYIYTYPLAVDISRLREGVLAATCRGPAAISISPGMCYLRSSMPRAQEVCHTRRDRKVGLTRELRSLLGRACVSHQHTVNLRMRTRSVNPTVYPSCYSLYPSHALRSSFTRS